MDASIEAELQALSDGLDQGLFPHNLDSLIDTSKRLIAQLYWGGGADDVLAALYDVESVLADLGEFWEDAPVAVPVYEAVNAELGPVLKRVVHAAIDPDQRVFLPSHTTALKRSWIGLQLTQSVR